MRNLIPDRRPNPPRRPLARLLDRFTPARLSIWYGPAGHCPLELPYARVCERCLHRGRRGHVEYFAGLAAARASAKLHRRTPGHRWMRVVYDPEGS